MSWCERCCVTQQIFVFVSFFPFQGSFIIFLCFLLCYHERWGCHRVRDLEFSFQCCLTARPLFFLLFLLQVRADLCWDIGEGSALLSHSICPKWSQSPDCRASVPALSFHPIVCIRASLLSLRAKNTKRSLKFFIPSFLRNWIRDPAAEFQRCQIPVAPISCWVLITSQSQAQSISYWYLLLGVVLKTLARPGKNWKEEDSHSFLSRCRTELKYNLRSDV